MRHRQTKNILNRPADQRKSLVRALLTSLFLYSSVTTTDAKAKALVIEADKLISKAKNYCEKNEEFNAIRALNSVLYTEKASKAALSFIQQTTKKSGFITTTKIKNRTGDNALLIKVSLIFDKK